MQGKAHAYYRHITDDLSYNRLPCGHKNARILRLPYNRLPWGTRRPTHCVFPFNRLPSGEKKA
jgi:hypothetical protein